ncbi:hypothetical protein K474DRAFT_1591300 [Panus rudis PR-1116 ss-1]|nr:hypothetical protein K474DRAFT_1591300 [Panus rudis PR-1116 ss-1]
MTVTASPIIPVVARHPLLLSRSVDPIVTSDDGTQSVIDPETLQPVDQGLATDGSGTDFDVAAIIWLAWSLAVGIPLALAGIRLWRLTTGVSLGIAFSVCVWAAFINTISASGLSDLVLTCIVMGAFVLGFAVGVFEIGRLAGISFLGILGGFSIAVRIVLFRDGLLAPPFFANWLICTAFGIAGFVLVVLRQRAAIVISSASVGTFLTALGIDLILNRQKGMSTGLRFLFDRNNHHLIDIFSRGWHPPLMTIIIMAASLGLIPILAYGQHRIFKRPFKPERPSSALYSVTDGEESYPQSGEVNNEGAHSRMALLEEKEPQTPSPQPQERSSSRFSM